VDLPRLYSGEPPVGFTPDPSLRSMRELLPPIYGIHAELIEEHTRVAFTRQWAYVWAVVLARQPVPLDTKTARLLAWLPCRSRVLPSPGHEASVRSIGGILRALLGPPGMGRLDRDT